MAANDRQEGGNHYRKAKVQHWDAIRDWMTPEQYEGYLLGSASKYLARYNDKDGEGGVKKSVHYLEKLLEFLASDKKEWEKKLEASPVAPEIIREVPEYLRSPHSNEYFTYEGGTAINELFRCKQCGAHFETPIFGEPSMYHYHQPDNGQDANPAYVNQ